MVRAGREEVQGERPLGPLRSAPRLVAAALALLLARRWRSGARPPPRAGARRRDRPSARRPRRRPHRPAPAPRRTAGTARARSCSRCPATRSFAARGGRRAGALGRGRRSSGRRCARTSTSCGASTCRSCSRCSIPRGATPATLALLRLDGDAAHRGDRRRARAAGAARASSTASGRARRMFLWRDPTRMAGRDPGARRPGRATGARGPGIPASADLTAPSRASSATPSLAAGRSSWAAHADGALQPGPRRAAAPVARRRAREPDPRGAEEARAREGGARAAASLVVGSVPWGERSRTRRLLLGAGAVARRWRWPCSRRWLIAAATPTPPDAARPVAAASPTPADGQPSHRLPSPATPSPSALAQAEQAPPAPPLRLSHPPLVDGRRQLPIARHAVESTPEVARASERRPRPAAERAAAQRDQPSATASPSPSSTTAWSAKATASTASASSASATPRSRSRSRAAARLLSF